MALVKQRLLVGRRHYGVGDWIMSMSCLKMLNRSQPQLVIDYDIRNAPPLHADIVRGFDADVVPITTLDPKAVYVAHIDHLSYPWWGNTHLIASMIEQVIRITGFAISYDVENLARYKGAVTPVVSTPGYVVIPSIGARNNPHKEWGVHRFQRLAQMLRDMGETVVQVGRTGDPELDAASHRCFDLTLAELVGLIRNSKYVIALENGISHLAGHLGHRCYTLYVHGAIKPVHTLYPGQTAITTAMTAEPEYVVNVIEGKAGSRKPREESVRVL